MKLPRVAASRFTLTLDHATPSASEQALRDAILAFAQNADIEQWDNLRFWADTITAADDEDTQNLRLAEFDQVLHDILPRPEDWPDTRIYVAPEDALALHAVIDAALAGDVTDIRRAS